MPSLWERAVMRSAGGKMRTRRQHWGRPRLLHPGRTPAGWDGSHIRGSVYQFSHPQSMGQSQVRRNGQILYSCARVLSPKTNWIFLNDMARHLKSSTPSTARSQSLSCLIRTSFVMGSSNFQSKAFTPIEVHQRWYEIADLNSER